MNTKITISALALGALLLSGCEKYPQEKSRAASIFPTVSSNETKGQIVTTDGINKVGESFKIHAYLDDDIATSESLLVDPDDKTNFHFIGGTISGEQLDYTGDGSTHSWDWHAATQISGTEEDKDAGRPMWRADIPIRFWSYYPTDVLDAFDPAITWPHTSSATPSDDNQKVVSFTYVLPDPAAAAPYQDAENQKDLLFAFNEEKRIFKNETEIDATNTGNSGTHSHSTTSYDEYIDIHFYHALAAVNFDITGMDSNVDFGTEITLMNVSFSGDCTATGAAVNSVSYVWTNQSTATRSFSQSFNKTDDFETLGTEPNQYIRQKTSGAKTFFMIPQTLTADTKLKVAFIFKSGGVPITREVAIGGLGAVSPATYATWEAGKIYTYRINVGDDDYTLLDVSLDVKDWVDGSMETSF